MARAGLKYFYNSKIWQQARAAALKRDHYSCQICGQRAEEVHHIVELDETNVKNPSIATGLSNLQSLCHECHTRLTTKEHRGTEPDSGMEYYFDENGMLKKFVNQKNLIPPRGTKMRVGGGRPVRAPRKN